MFRILKHLQLFNQTLFGIALFGLMLNIPVNSYGHVVAVSSSNHAFFLGKLD